MFIGITKHILTVLAYMGFPTEVNPTTPPQGNVTFNASYNFYTNLPLNPHGLPFHWSHMPMKKARITGEARVKGRA